MGPQSKSGFYLSRKVVAAFALLLLALLLAVVVLAILYARGWQPEAAEVPPTVWLMPSPAPEPTFPGRSGLWNHSRLPSSLSPSHYQLEFWPRLEPGEDGVYLFSGQVSVTFTCHEETQIILIHSNNLNYSGIELSPSQAPAILDTWVEVKNEYLVIELESKLEPGQVYSLQLNYSGQLWETLRGLYISHYRDQGINKTLAVTQMEPTYARSAFPCFDEPHMKATFDIRLVHRSQFVALSNMPAIAVSERLEDDGIWNVTTFNTTVIMSTYLVAFAVCDYDSIGTTYGGTEIRIWAKKESILNGEAQFALNITGPLLKFFEIYYNISYPLPKADLIALPEFEASAMENWGLLMFKDNVLLYDPNEKLVDHKNLITLMISHELAHQWFGNLVTMKWWNDLWLNEGITTYVEHLGSDHLGIDAQLHSLIHQMPHIFHWEYNSRSHPVSLKEENIQTTKDIVELFDYITYTKGALVIRMVSAFLTEELLVKGLRTYLKAFSYSNVVSNDLWHHLQMAVDSQNEVKLPAPIKNILDTWVVQSGFPLITVNTSIGSLMQKQHIGNSEENQTLSSTWFIPIFWMKNGSMQPLLWLNTENETFPELKTTTDEEWIIVNVNQSCFCRVNYDDTNWNRIQQQLQKDHSVISASDRAQLINDAFMLVNSKQIGIKIALGMTIYLTNERKIMVWFRAIDYLQLIEKRLLNTHLHQHVKKFLINTIFPFYNYLLPSFENNFRKEGDMARETFAKTFQSMCQLDVKDCVSRATSMYSEWMSDPENNIIPEYIRETVYCTAIKVGNEKDWDFAWAQYEKKTSVEECYNLLNGMSCSREPWILKRYLSYTINEEKISHENYLMVLNGISENPFGQFLAWNFIRANWEQLKLKTDDFLSDLKTLLYGVINMISSEFQLQELQVFLNSIIEHGDRKTVDKLFEVAKELLNWKEKLKVDVHDWLRENIPISDS